MSLLYALIVNIHPVAIAAIHTIWYLLFNLPSYSLIIHSLFTPGSKGGKGYDDRGRSPPRRSPPRRSPPRRSPPRFAAHPPQYSLTITLSVHYSLTIPSLSAYCSHRFDERRPQVLNLHSLLDHYSFTTCSLIAHYSLYFTPHNYTSSPLSDCLHGICSLFTQYSLTVHVLFISLIGAARHWLLTICTIALTIHGSLFTVGLARCQYNDRRGDPGAYHWLTIRYVHTSWIIH